MRGMTIFSPNSLLKKNMRSMILIGTIPRMGMVYLIIFRTRPNFLISPENLSTMGLGKTFVQKPSRPLPNDTWSLTSCWEWPYFLK